MKEIVNNPATATDSSSSSSPPALARLARTLTLWDLILYGVIVIQPVAPMSVFGVLSDRARGHVVTVILLAMIAMLFTAISYGRMARVYPSAGSAFTYVSRPAKIGGVIWMAVGIAFGIWKTRGFRTGLVDFELPPESEAR